MRIANQLAEAVEEGPSKGQLDRASAEWTKYAGGEPVKVESIKGKLYGMGSELAVLRLYHKFRGGKARAEYSKNLKTWVFSMDT